MGKIGVYGGSFNPIHLGHIQAAEEMAQALNLDQVLIVPASVPPHKQMPAYSPSAEERLELVRLSLMDHPRLSACDLELRRSGPSYTVDTLTQLHAMRPEDEIYLLMGTDMFLSLHSWYRADEICRLARIVCAARETERPDKELEEQAKRLKKELHAKVTLVQNHPLEMSSTTVRRMIFFDCAQDYLAPQALAYIEAHQLYGAKRDWTHLNLERLSFHSLAQHKPPRAKHAQGVCLTAQKLAERWGERIDLAARAGILHDVTKALDGPEQLKLCARYGLQLSPFEQTHPKLLHAKTGAAVAKHIFGECDKVCRAIYWHTTGHADMTLMEKILYIADYAEPGRSFDGVERIRKNLYQDLDLALYTGFCMSLEELAREGKEVDVYSMEAAQFLKKERGFA